MSGVTASIRDRRASPGSGPVRRNSGRARGQGARPSVAAFSLSEMLFVLAIGSFIAAGVTTSYIFSLKGFRGLSHYNEMQADGRRALDWFARDMRTSMGIVSCNQTQVVALLPASFDNAGQVTATNRVNHSLQGGNWYRQVNTSGPTLLAESVHTLTFSLYDTADNLTTQTSRAVSIQVDADLRKSVVGRDQTSDFLSARLRLRNKE